MQQRDTPFIPVRILIVEVIISIFNRLWKENKDGEVEQALWDLPNVDFDQHWFR